MTQINIITGAAGFVGRCLSKHLLADGENVVGFDNLSRGTQRNIAEFGGSKFFRFQSVELSDLAAYRSAIQPFISAGCDALVWHLAANSDILAGVRDPGIDLRDTFATTHNTLQIMREFNLRKLVFASSSAVYGALDGALHEDIGPLFPISNYGAMKLASEAAISAAVEAFLDHAWICRFPNVVGAFATHGVMFDFAQKLNVRQDELEVLGDGNQRKAYLLVDELVDAMQFIVKYTMAPLNYYNIGPQDEGVTVKFIAEQLLREANSGAKIRYTGGTKGWVGDVPRFSYSVEKLAQLGWRPQTSSAEAVRIAAKAIWQENKNR